MYTKLTFEIFIEPFQHFSLVMFLNSVVALLFTYKKTMLPSQDGNVAVCSQTHPGTLLSHGALGRTGLVGNTKSLVLNEQYSII